MFMSIMDEVLAAGVSAIKTGKYTGRKTAHEYVDDKPTDKVVGYRYTVVLPEMGFAQIDVKIEGEAQLEVPEKPYDVTFVNLRAVPYVNNRTRRPALSFRADGIRAAK